jgi:cytidylate kinase
LADIITLDGPAGAGKSSVGSRVAATLGWLFVDTGLFYRVVTLQAQRQGVPLDDEAALGRLSAELDVRLVPADGPPHVSLAGENVTPHLRGPAIDRVVSMVAASPAVRAALVGPQRAAVGPHAAVVAGRDIGTVIFPDAPLKVYLDATLSERARRRRAELSHVDGAPSFDSVVGDLERRDRLDSSRAAAPLVCPPDAVRIDTDELPLEAVVERVLALWRQRAAGSRR